MVGPQVTLAGNLDPVAAVCFSDPETIHEQFKRLYEQLGNPYMVTAGCEIPSGTPPENLRALCRPISYRPHDHA